MKPYVFLGILLLFLSGCTVEVIEPEPVPQVVVTPVNPAVAPGGQVELKAALDNGSVAEFDWEVPVGSSFETLATDTIRLTAPTEGGTYPVKATARNVEATAGETQVIVDILLSGETKDATAAPTDDSVPPALVTASIAAGGTNYWTINVPADVAASGKALYIDVFPQVDVPIELTVYNSDRTAFASSSSNKFFAPGETAFATPQMFAPASITAGASVCIGSCVIQAANTNVYYVKITNTEDVPVTYELFAFVSIFGDAEEDANDVIATATSLTDSQSSGIEEIGDIDYYSVGTANRTLRFNTTAVDLALQAVVTRSGVQVATLTNAQTAAVQVGDIIEVKSTNNRAADSSELYNLELF